MKTYGEVVAEVLRYGFDDGPQVNKARIEQWVNEAQLQVARHADAAPEFEETEEKAMTVGTYKYAQPSECLALMSIAYPAAERRLKPVDLQTFDTYSVGEINAPPLLYTTFKTEFWLFPIPTSADKLQIRYVKRPPRMTAEANTPVLAEDYLHLLVDYTLARAYRAEDDKEGAAEHQQQYERDLAKYLVDVRHQQDDRPKQLQGTWTT